MEVVGISQLWKIYLFESGRKLTTGVKFEVSVKKWSEETAKLSFYCFFYLKFFGYVNGIQLAKSYRLCLIGSARRVAQFVYMGMPMIC